MQRAKFYKLDLHNFALCIRWYNAESKQWVLVLVSSYMGCILICCYYLYICLSIYLYLLVVFFMHLSVWLFYFLFGNKLRKKKDILQRKKASKPTTVQIPTEMSDRIFPMPKPVFLFVSIDYHLLACYTWPCCLLELVGFFDHNCSVFHCNVATISWDLLYA